MCDWTERRLDCLFMDYMPDWIGKIEMLVSRLLQMLCGGLKPLIWMVYE